MDDVTTNMAVSNIRKSYGYTNKAAANMDKGGKFKRFISLGLSFKIIYEH